MEHVLRAMPSMNPDIFLLKARRHIHLAHNGYAQGLTRNRKASLHIVDTAERTAIAMATLITSGPLFGHASGVAVVGIVDSLINAVVG